MASGNRAELVRGVTMRVLDLVFPPACPSCRDPVGVQGNFCAPCFQKLQLIADPQCHCCGIPFMVPMDKGALCPVCFESPPAYSALRAAMVYDGVSAPLVSALKFADQWEGLGRYAQMMVAAGKEVLEGAELLVPVPLHWRRAFRRKFNQSALLAYQVEKRTGIPCQTGLLQRIRYTQPQMKLDRKARASNVKRAFEVAADKATEVADKVVVLVDDVVTTGATVQACAEALLKAGAREVRVLALARTIAH